MGEGHATGLVKQLSETPAAFESALARLGEKRFQRRPSESEWSALDVLRHVRASDYILSSRCWNALIPGDAVHPGLDEVRYLELLRRAALPAREELMAFALRRRELVGLLTDLAPDGWATVITTDFGSAELRERCASLLGHELEHIGQLTAILDRAASRCKRQRSTSD